MSLSRDVGTKGFSSIRTRQNLVGSCQGQSSYLSRDPGEASFLRLVQERFLTFGALARASPHRVRPSSGCSNHRLLGLLHFRSFCSRLCLCLVD